MSIKKLFLSIITLCILVFIGYHGYSYISKSKNDIDIQRLWSVSDFAVISTTGEDQSKISFYDEKDKIINLVNMSGKGNRLESNSSIGETKNKYILFKNTTSYGVEDKLSIMDKKTMEIKSLKVPESRGYYITNPMKDNFYYVNTNLSDKKTKITYFTYKDNSYEGNSRDFNLSVDNLSGMLEKNGVIYAVKGNLKEENKNEIAVIKYKQDENNKENKSDNENNIEYIQSMENKRIDSLLYVDDKDLYYIIDENKSDDNKNISENKKNNNIYLVKYNFDNKISKKYKLETKNNNFYAYKDDKKQRLYIFSNKYGINEDVDKLPYYDFRLDKIGYESIGQAPSAIGVRERELYELYSDRIKVYDLDTIKLKKNIKIEKINKMNNTILLLRSTK